MPAKNIEEIEGKMKDWRAMIQAMTLMEREDPELLNSQRIKRIARGTGVPERDVKGSAYKIQASEISDESEQRQAV